MVKSFSRGTLQVLSLIPSQSRIQQSEQEIIEQSTYISNPPPPGPFFQSVGLNFIMPVYICWNIMRTSQNHVKNNVLPLTLANNYMLIDVGDKAKEINQSWMQQKDWEASKVPQMSRQAFPSECNTRRCLKRKKWVSRCYTSMKGCLPQERIINNSKE